MCSPDRRRVEPPDWILALAAERPYGENDRRGTANLVDAAARARAAELIRTGESVSIARPLRGNDVDVTPEHPGYHHDMWYVPTEDGMGWGLDHLVLNAHGLLN